MSSFKRKIKNDSSSSERVEEVKISGVKPWIHNGLGILSSGHRELDEIIGGGIPVGTINLYLNDNFSNYGETLASYNIAEALSHSHHVLLISPYSWTVDSILNNLPKNLSAAKLYQEMEVEELDGKVNEISKDDGNSNITKNSSSTDFGLKIAWQYEKYLSKYILK
jgi:elongator complex protein 4